MPTPTCGARMGACEPPPNRRPGLLHTIRSAISHRPTNGPVLPRLLTRPDPMGAETQVGMAVGCHLLAQRKPGVQIPSPPPHPDDQRNRRSTGVDVSPSSLHSG